VVLYQNQFYYFFALWPDENDGDDHDSKNANNDNNNTSSKKCTVAVSEADIYDILLAIRTHATTSSKNDTSNNNESHGIGVFTTLPRSQWAVIRQEICDCNETINTLTLRMIDSALFILVLDDYIPANVHAAAANMLHGMNVRADDNEKDMGGT
jgi:carnitine O-acetyltransferase